MSPCTAAKVSGKVSHGILESNSGSYINILTDAHVPGKVGMCVTMSTSARIIIISISISIIISLVFMARVSGHKTGSTKQRTRCWS